MPRSSSALQWQLVDSVGAPSTGVTAASRPKSSETSSGLIRAHAPRGTSPAAPSSVACRTSSLPQPPTSSAAASATAPDHLLCMAAGWQVRTPLVASGAGPGGGGLMFGTHTEDGVIQNPGCSAAYLVTPEPDATFDRAVTAGGTVVRAMRDQEYGGRGGSVEDPEGNHWSFGDYQPA